MNRLLWVLTTIAGMIVGAPLASAQGPGSYAYIEERWGFGIQVDASFVAPDGCQTMLSVGRGAPPGVQLASHEIIPVTVVIAADPRGCSGQRVLRRVFGIGGGSMLNVVQIFFVSQHGQILRTEKVAVQSR